MAEKRGRGRPKQFQDRLQVKVTAAQAAGLEEIAAQRGITVSDVVREAVDSQLCVMNKIERN